MQSHTPTTILSNDAYPLYVNRNDIEYVWHTWLKKPYIKVADETTLQKQLLGELNELKIDLSLERFSQSVFYQKRKPHKSLYQSTCTEIKLMDTAIDAWGKVQRPNHGLSHTLRTVSYVSEVVQYLKSFNPRFTNLNQHDIKKIQYAALFSVVGRLNECGWANDLMTYSYFRWRSGEIFYHYMTETIDGTPRYQLIGFNDLKEVRYYQDQIMDMGDPDNLEPIHVVLNLTHKIDLMRCSTGDNDFKTRFNTYAEDFLDSDSIKKLEKLGAAYIIKTGENIITGHTVEKERFREGILFEKCELSIDACLQAITEAYITTVENKITMPPFIAKTAGGYRHLKGNFADFLEDLIRSPRENRSREGYRKLFNKKTKHRNPTHETIRASGTYVIGEKDPQLTENEKENFSFLTSCSYINPEHKTPAFGHDGQNWKYVFGIGIDPKDIHFKQGMTKDFNNHLRTLEKNAKLAKTLHKDYKDILADDLLTLTKLVEANTYQNRHNEIIARLRWNCDGTSKIIIYANTLSSRLIAHHFAQFIQNRLKNPTTAVGYYEGYIVPIQFYTPYDLDANEHFYTEEMYARDVDLAKRIFSDDTLRKEHYTANDYNFLMGLPAAIILQALQEGINEVPLWLNMINSYHHTILEILINKLNANQILLFREAVTKQTIASNPIEIEIIQTIVQHGCLHILQVIHASSLKGLLAAHLKPLIELAIAEGRKEIFQYLISIASPEDQLSMEDYLLVIITEKQLPAFLYMLTMVDTQNPIFLSKAIEVGDLKAIQILQANGASITKLMSDGVSALHIAAKSGRNTIVKYLLSNDELAKNINASDKSGRTPLHYATIAGNNHTVTLLLQRGADIDAKDHVRCSALSMALETKQYELFQNLLEAGANTYSANSLRDLLLELFSKINNTSSSVELLLLIDMFVYLIEFLERKNISFTLNFNNDHFREVLVKYATCIGTFS